MGIEFSDICKSWSGQEILSRVSLQCDAGETLVLLGPSGAGKSSLLRLLNLLDIPDAGELTIAGQHFSFPAPNPRTLHKQAQQLRCKVGMVFQQYHLWPHLTVEQNLLEAPLKVLGMDKAKARDRAGELLAQLKLADKRQAWPGALSGGQQQRVAIARALMMNPSVLLFDEPTAALDPEITKEVAEIILQLGKTGITQVVVTHEVGFARRVATKVAYLEQGKLVEYGDADRLSQPQTRRLAEFLTH
ncbi:ATP-binding cassette domain-containing protein [Zobellella maritima]|uniref:ATP-binding cassette domain-containing protein n=1 Tax=Zobellella maritima TaxID=2059725 RepID=UPI000E307430|nr:ATP-binding cassette domain-containing protein [Zobellella maritima]